MVVIGYSLKMGKDCCAPEVDGASQNWIRILRVAILCFLAGVLTALPHYLMNA